MSLQEDFDNGDWLSRVQLPATSSQGQASEKKHSTTCQASNRALLIFFQTSQSGSLRDQQKSCTYAPTLTILD